MKTKLKRLRLKRRSNNDGNMRIIEEGKICRTQELTRLGWIHAMLKSVSKDA